jgi:membrane protein YqaA with SNARE-associated domain
MAKGQSKSPSNKPQAKQANPPKASSKQEVANKPEIEKVTLWKNPIRTLQLFTAVLARFFGNIFRHILRNIIYYIILAAIIIVPHVVHGPHTPMVKKIDEIAEFAGYWIILGVASSIGLGTGLHTFVLYLGPHIAKVTMVANECNAIPEYLPSRWAIRPTFGPCPDGEREQISFFDILLQVQIEAFLWGLGTALGELPPYFVALAASKAGKTSEELEELRHSQNATLMDKAKLLIYKSLQRYAFITVLLCASIPNPLFDLAGITCGHFGIAFTTFFTATAIGKSIIKTHIQMIFVILMFSHHHVENLLSFVEAHVPFLSGYLTKTLEKQKTLLHTPPDSISDSKPLVAQLWDYFIAFMIISFLISIIQSLANGELEEQQREAEEKDNKKDKKKQ